MSQITGRERISQHLLSCPPLTPSVAVWGTGSLAARGWHGRWQEGPSAPSHRPAGNICFYEWRVLFFLFFFSNKSIYFPVTCGCTHAQGSVPGVRPLPAGSSCPACNIPVSHRAPRSPGLAGGCASENKNQPELSKCLFRPWRVQGVLTNSLEAGDRHTARHSSSGSRSPVRSWRGLYANPVLKCLLPGEKALRKWSAPSC